MTDQELLRLAKKVDRLSARARKYQEDAQAIKDQIEAELAERETSQLVTGGMRITRVAPQSVRYDEEALRHKLGPRRWAQCTEPRFNPDKLLALVQDGAVRIATVERHSSVVEGTPYVRITPVDSR